jgi:hypothetical protein
MKAFSFWLIAIDSLNSLIEENCSDSALQKDKDKSRNKMILSVINLS